MNTVPPAVRSAERDLFEAQVFEKGGQRLPYRLLPPRHLEDSNRYPLVLFLHGAGERGTDNQAQLKHGARELASSAFRERFPAYVIAPQCPPDDQWVNVPWTEDSHTIPAEPSETLALTIALVDELAERLPIDSSRVYVTGLSMGGFGVWDLLARRPFRFAAAVSVCGGADTSTAEHIKHIPVWVFHGEQDTAVKTQRSRDIVAALKAAGGQVKYTEYEGLGHDSWTRTYQNPAVYEWLFSQQRLESGQAN